MFTLTLIVVCFAQSTMIVTIAGTDTNMRVMQMRDDDEILIALSDDDVCDVV
jgi:hypothetical protein